MKESKTKLMQVLEEIETETSEVLWRINEQKRRKCYFSLLPLLILCSLLGEG